MTTLRNSMQRVAAPIGTISEHPDSPLQPGGTHNDDRMEDLLDDWDDRHRCEIRDAIIAFAGIPFPFFFPCFDVNPTTLAGLGESYWVLMPGKLLPGPGRRHPGEHILDAGTDGHEHRMDRVQARHEGGARVDPLSRSAPHRAVRRRGR